MAEERYNDALRLDSAQLQLYRSKALALQFDNKRIQALDTILQGLKLSGQATTTQPLHETANDVIRALQAIEFDEAEASLDQAFLAGVPVANEYALLVSRKWEYFFDTNWTPDTRAKAREARDRHPTDPGILVIAYGDSAQAELVDGNQERLMGFIQEAEKQPVDQVPAFLRAWIDRIQAHAQIINGEYEKAYDSAEAAYHLQQTDDSVYLMADATLLTTQCQEWKWVLGQKEADPEKCKLEFLIGNEEKKASVNLTADQVRELRKQYQQAADRAATLVAKRYQAAYAVLMRANHSLGEDQKTRELFMGVIQQDAKDESALEVLQDVCSQYLFDFDCSFVAAQKAAELLASNEARATASDYLNIAELAVLKGDNKTAAKWLASAGQPQTMKPRDASLFYLYRLWIAMRIGQTDEFKTDFDGWKEATKRFREDKAELNWIFTGAEKALDRSKIEMGEDQTLLLTSMMNVLKNDNLPLLSWPEAVGRVHQ